MINEMINNVIARKLAFCMVFFAFGKEIQAEFKSLTIALESLPKQFGKTSFSSSSYSSIKTDGTNFVSSSKTGLSKSTFVIEVASAKEAEGQIQAYIRQVLSNCQTDGHLSCQMKKLDQKSLEVTIEYDSTKFEVSTLFGAGNPGKKVGTLNLTISPKSPKHAVAALSVSPTCYVVKIDQWDLPKCAVV